MLKYNNTHVFTGYLKQLLKSVNIPACKIYTRDFAKHLQDSGSEDPRLIESFDSLSKSRPALRINYLKNNEFYNYFSRIDTAQPFYWQRANNAFYDVEKQIPGLTKALHSPGPYYDTITHEYLGEYLRFVRDYYNINLMSLYNCFNNKTCNNLRFTQTITLNTAAKEKKELKVTFNSLDSRYRIYAIPVKLFADYTIAIDCCYGIELFCGIFGTSLDISDKGIDLFLRTYKKISQPTFSCPILYDSLNVRYWPGGIANIANRTGTNQQEGTENLEKMTRWDLAEREQDLKLFIKVPAACKSSITVLEGDFRCHNNSLYAPHIDQDSRALNAWKYEQNHCVLNFGTIGTADGGTAKVDLNTDSFKPISKLQLLAFNTGESYPFADRLIEYLTGSAITPIDPIADNIKRAQRVMNQNNYHFKIEGLWENKIQKIVYDYITNAGPIELENNKIINRHSGHNPKHYGYLTTVGHTTKSTLYDTLGYIDKDAEKWYASWKVVDNKVKMQNNIQNVDIYNGLYDL